MALRWASKVELCRRSLSTAASIQALNFESDGGTSATKILKLSVTNRLTRKRGWEPNAGAETGRRDARVYVHQLHSSDPRFSSTSRSW